MSDQPTSAPALSSLWLEAAPLVLASASRTRGALLTSAAIPFVSIPAAIDERDLEAPLKAKNAGSPAIAAALARAKAEHVAAAQPDRLVLGADQTLSLDGEHFTKPADRAAAAHQLEALSGRTHYLHSALAIAAGGEVVFETLMTAALTVRVLDHAFIERYLDLAGPDVLRSVGAYQVEGLGVHLFDRVEGDHSTILGLPMFPLLQFLRRRGAIAG